MAGILEGASSATAGAGMLSLLFIYYLFYHDRHEDRTDHHGDDNCRPHIGASFHIFYFLISFLFFLASI